MSVRSPVMVSTVPEMVSVPATACTFSTIGVCVCVCVCVENSYEEASDEGCCHPDEQAENEVPSRQLTQNQRPTITVVWGREVCQEGRG